MVHLLPGLKPQSDWQMRHIPLRFECASSLLFRRASFGRNACRRCILARAFAFFQVFLFMEAVGVVHLAFCFCKGT